MTPTTEDRSVSPREAFVQFLKALPPEAVLWKTMSRCFTAEELAELLEMGDEYARIWLSDSLRVARDVLAKKTARQIVEHASRRLEGPRFPDVAKIQPRSPFISLLRELPEDATVLILTKGAYSASEIEGLMSVPGSVADAWLQNVLLIFREMHLQAVLSESKQGCKK